MVGQELQGNYFNNRLQQASALRVRARCTRNLFHLAVGFAYDRKYWNFTIDKLTNAGKVCHTAALNQNRDGPAWPVQRSASARSPAPWAMFQLAGGVPFSVNVRNLLSLRRAFQRNG